MIYYHRDPIFKFFKRTDAAQFMFNGAASKEIERRTGKRLIAAWTDGYDYQNFFAQDYSKQLIITNNTVTLPPDHAQHVHQANPSFHGIYYNDYPALDITPVKDFNCFINRYDITRQSWFYQLIRQGLIDRGYVSFNSDVSPIRSPSAEFKNLTPSQAFDLGFEKFNSIFADEHAKIRDQIPYKNFEDTGDLTPVVLGSKFSIVLETFFHDNNIITFSEKIFRCLQLPRPWVLFSSQYGVAHLEQMGFDVLRDIVDHSYDAIANPIERQMAILEQVKVLADQPLSLERCIAASEHNKALLKSWHDAWLVNITEDFAIAESKLNAL